MSCYSYHVFLFSGTVLAYSSGAHHPGFSDGHVAGSLVFCVIFCRSLFVLLPFFVWSLFCLSVDLQFLAAPLVSSNVS